MALPEFKSPKVANPRFGYQQYQYANKSAAELKTSLWTANLSEVVVKTAIDTGLFPIKNEIRINFVHEGGDPSVGDFTFNSVKRSPSKTITSLKDLSEELNKVYPFLGKFTYGEVSPGKVGILLQVDKTFLGGESGVDGYTFTITLA